MSDTKNYLLLNVLDNVRSKLYALSRAEGHWKRTALEAPEFGSTRSTESTLTNPMITF